MTRETPDVPESREAITSRIAELRRISTPEGIEALESVEIGGTRQWISIRGLNRANPVLLFIHGGPGSSMMPLSWAFQQPWEDFFTVVQWDQRGVGKNAATADREVLTPTLSVERIVQDAEEMVAYLRRRLGKDRIVVMGFSWGTIVGTLLAQRRPEWLHAYVGVGQSVDAGDERHIYDRLIEHARANGNTEALMELEALAPYPGPDNYAPGSSVRIVRKWARAFNGGWYGRPDFRLYFALPEWAPEYGQEDVEMLLPATQWAGDELLHAMLQIELSKTAVEFHCPVLLLMGRHDLHTPYGPAREYFERILAPHKRFLTFERSAHFPMFEEPGRFLMALVNEVLPLTGEAAQFEPDV